MEQVTIKTLNHKGEVCFGISFGYNNVIKQKIKSIPGALWSATHKTFYVYKKQYAMSQLNKLLKDKNIQVIKLVPTKTTKRALNEGQKQVVRTYVSYLKGLRLSERTIKIYFTFIADFIAFLDNKPLTDISNNDVRLFVEHQVKTKKYAISTHRQMISAIKHFGYFTPNSQLEIELLQRPKKSSYLPTVLSKAEIIDLIRVTKNLKHRAVIALLYSCGLRVGEIITLQLSHIDIDRRQLFIKSGKGRKDRVVILAESFIPLCKNYIMTYGPKKYFLENPNHGGPYNAGSIRKFLKKSCKAANIYKRVTPHTLRHSYATHLIENGVGLRYVQDLLGHSKPETTMIYTHVAKKDLLNIQSPLDTIIRHLSETDKHNQKVLLSRNISG